MTPAVRRLNDLLTANGADLPQRLFGPSGEAPRTLLHRDFSLSNLVFTDAVTPVVIDWQLMSRGRGPFDIAWFLGQSLTIDQRRAQFDDVCEVYKSVLSGRGIGYALDDITRDVRLAWLQRFGSLVSTIAAMPMTNETAAFTTDILLPRNLAAIEDSGAAELIA